MHKRSRSLLARAAGLCVWLPPVCGFAVVHTWTGANGAAKIYSDPLNWSPNGVPGSIDTALFTANGTAVFNNSPFVGFATVAGCSFSMGQSGDHEWIVGQVLRVESTGSFTLTGGLDMQPGSIDASNGGTVTINSGSQVDALAFTTSPAATVGNGVSGALIVNSGGTFNASNGITLGTDVPGNGYTNGMILFNGGSGTINNVNIASADFRACSASLTISNGGVVNQTVGLMSLAQGDSATATATFTITGAGSAYHNRTGNQGIEVGGTGSGTINVNNGGWLDVTSNVAALGVNAHGVVAVNGGSVTVAGGIFVTGGSLSLGSGSITVGSGARIVITSGGQFRSSIDYTVSPNSQFSVASSAIATFDGGLNAAMNNAATLTFSSTVNVASSSTWGNGSASFVSGSFSGAANVSIPGLSIGIDGGGSSVGFTGGSLNVGSLGLTAGGGTSSKTALISVNAGTGFLNSAGNVNLLSRSMLTLQNNGNVAIGGNLNIDAGTFDAVGGSFSFTGANYTVGISNAGLFNAASLSTAGHTSTLTIDTGGKLLLNGSFGANRTTISVSDANSMLQAASLTCAAASINISNGGAGSFTSVSLGDTLLGPSTVTVGAGGTLRTDTLSNAFSGQLNFTGAGTINQTATNLGRIHVAGALSVGQTMTNNGAIYTESTGVATFANVDGTGSFNLSGSSSATANYVRQASIEFSGPSSFVTRSNGTNSGVSRTGSLTFDDLSVAGQRWDLMDNALIVDYAKTLSDPLLAIRDDLVAGRNNGQWKGNGLASTSAQAAAASAHPTALGFAENSALGYSTFMGQAVDSTTVLVRYTYVGDANLDVQVNALDFNALASNFGESGTFWSDGDFNFDGTVNTQDFTLLATNFNQVLASPALGSIVPEPTALLIGLFPLRLRRRRDRLRSPNAS